MYSHEGQVEYARY